MENVCVVVHAVRSCDLSSSESSEFRVECEVRACVHVHKSGTFFVGARRGMGEPCLVLAPGCAPGLSWNCRTRLRTSPWSASTCLRGSRRNSADTSEALHLRI